MSLLNARTWRVKVRISAAAAIVTKLGMNLVALQFFYHQSYVVYSKPIRDPL